MIYKNMELNITLACNASCNNCNRLCNKKIYKDYMEVYQIDNFLENLRIKNLIINKVKIIGGEPLLHYNFRIIYSKLLLAVEEGIINRIKIDTNRIIPFPTDLRITNKVRILGKGFKRKRHLPVLWSPEDMGYKLKPNYNCEMMARCGFSLDSRGYLPCSMAIILNRLLNLNLYKLEIPLEPWGLELICKHCIFNMPEDWKKEHAYPINETPEEALIPTKTFKEALKDLEAIKTNKNL